MDERFNFNLEVQVVFAANDKQEAIIVAKDFGLGTVVVRLDESGLLARFLSACVYCSMSFIADAVLFLAIQI